MSERAEYEIFLRDRFLPNLKKTDRGLNKFEAHLNKTNKSASLLGSSLGKVFAGLAIGAGVVALGKKVFSLGVKMEQTRVSFETFLGSAERADKTLKELNEFSNVTPFTNEEVIKSGKSLLAFGVSNRKLIPTLKKIGDISAATGKDFNELTTIYGKARIAGTLYAEDINQLVEAGIPIIDLFAKQLGISNNQVKKFASEGKLQFSELEKAFTSLTSEGGRFFNLMEKQSQTVGGKISTLVGKFQLLGSSIGEAIAPLVAPLLDDAIGKIDMLVDRTGTLTKKSDSQFDSIVKMNQVLLPQIDRYDELSSTFWRTNEQQKELEKLQSDIAKALPSSISHWNDLGEVMEISGQKAKEAIEIQKQGFLGASGNLLKEREDELSALEKRIGTVQGLLEETKEGGMAEGTFTAESVAKGLGSLGKLQNERAQIIAAIGRLKAQRNEVLTNSFGTIGEEFIPDEGDDLSNPLGGGASVGPASRKSNTKNNVSGVRSGGVRDVTINIEKLIENIVFQKPGVQQNELEMQEVVKRTILRAVNDASILTE